MQGPRSPNTTEIPKVFDFLNQTLRNQSTWSIANEYPTAFHSNNIHNIRIITDNENILSHAVLKPLIVKSPHVIFKVGSIGSVVTAESHRGHGLSTQILENCIDSARQQNCDIAILWTDLFEFYRKLGFELAGSEHSFLIEKPFAVDGPRLRFSSDLKVSPEALLKLYNQHSVNSVRNVDDIRKFLNIPQTKLYTAWDVDHQLKAYAVEGKGADLNGYIHEWGGGSVTDLLSLFSWIVSEKKSPITIICPQHAHRLAMELKTQATFCNEGFLGMIKILDHDQLFAKIKRSFRSLGIADFVLEKHPQHCLFGFDKELFTVNTDSALVQLLFGPLNYADLGIFSAENLRKIENVLPLKFWIWGWDSI